MSERDPYRKVEIVRIVECESCEKKAAERKALWKFWGWRLRFLRWTVPTATTLWLMAILLNNSEARVLFSLTGSLAVGLIFIGFAGAFGKD